MTKIKRASDGTTHAFPDSASDDAINHAMLAYENRDSWGPGLFGAVSKAVGQQVLNFSHLAGPHNFGLEP